QSKDIRRLHRGARAGLAVVIQLGCTWQSGRVGDCPQKIVAVKEKARSPGPCLGSRTIAATAASGMTSDADHGIRDDTTTRPRESSQQPGPFGLASVQTRPPGLP